MMNYREEQYDYHDTTEYIEQIRNLPCKGNRRKAYGGPEQFKSDTRIECNRSHEHPDGVTTNVQSLSDRSYVRRWQPPHPHVE